MISRFSWTLALVATLFSVSCSNALASSTGLTIQPIKISETINPGESKSGFITLTNASNQSVMVELGVEDFIPTAGTSNISFVGRAEGNTTVRDWITLGTSNSFVFKQGESKNIQYTITAPANAEPGGHFGVIFFKASEINQTGQLKIGARVGVLVFATIPGDSLQKGRILDFTAPTFIEGKSVPFVINFENTGTVHFEPKGEINVKNLFGKEVAKIPVSGQAVLPTGSREIMANWNTEGLLLGRYTASVKLFDGEGNELSAEDISFYGFPLKLVVMFVLSVAVLFTAFKYLRRRINISVTISR